MENKYSGLLIMCLLLTGCYEEKSIAINEVIKEFSVSPASMPADGVSKAQVIVVLPDQVIDAKRTVVFTTTRGTFEVEGKNTVTVTALDTVINGTRKVAAITTLLGVNEEGTATVTARVQNYAAGSTVTFLRAYPDYVSLSVDKLSLKAEPNTEIAVTTQLKRNTGAGKTSAGQPITLEAFDTGGNPIGTFRNKVLITDAEGKCVNYFSVSSSAGYLGQVVLKTTARNASNEEVSSTALVNIIK